MFGNLGPALQPLTQAFQVPGGIPLVTGSIDDAVNFSLMLEKFARGLYLSPAVLGASEIGPTTGVLADDVLFVLVLENRASGAGATGRGHDAGQSEPGRPDRRPERGHRGRRGRRRVARRGGAAAGVGRRLDPVRRHAEHATGDGRYQRFDVQFAESVNLFHSPLKAGATVRYRTTTGGWAVAEVAEVGRHTLTLQIRGGMVGSETQPATARIAR